MDTLPNPPRRGEERFSLGSVGDLLFCCGQLFIIV